MANILKGLVRLNAARLITWKPTKLQYIQRRSMYPQMSSNIIAGPPRVRIPTAERFLAGLWFAVAILGTPVFVLLNLNNYRTLVNIWDEVVEEEEEAAGEAAAVEDGKDAEASAATESEELEENGNC